MQFQRKHENAIIPTKGTPNSAGYDLYALEDAVIVGGEGNVMVRTGIACKPPSNCYGRLAMRSGLARDKHLDISAGVIDKDYSGEIMVLVHCLRNGLTVEIKAGERFAQIIPERVSYATSEVVDQLDGDHAGFGSTGAF